MDPRIQSFHRAAARWASGYFLSEKDFLSTIRTTRVETLRYSRARVRGKTRLIAARHELALEPGRPEAPARMEDFDPWAETRESIRAKTRQIVSCKTCGGSKRMVCPSCAGRTRIKCPSCVGGMQLSLKTGKLINCRSCRGKGERSCPSCRTGSVTCQLCEGKGRLLRWLDLEEQDLTFAFESPSNALRESISPFSFDDPADALPVAPFRTWSGSPDRPPPDVDAFLSGIAWRQRIDRRHDRVATIDYQSFASESAIIEYELLGRRASVEVKAWDQTVVSSPGNASPLWRRLWLLGTGSLGAIAGGFLLASWYGGRHSFLAASVHRSMLLTMALILGVVLLWPLSRLGFSAGKRARRWTWLPALLVAGAQVATAATGYPSLRHALELQEQGLEAAALAEAAACADLRRDPERCAELHDRLRLAAARATGTPQDAWRAAADRYYGEAARRQAAEHARELTLATALSLEASRRFGDLDTLLREVDNSLRTDPSFSALLVRLHRRQLTDCFPRLDRRCAREALARAASAGLTEQDLAEARSEGRLAALEALAPELRILRSSRPFGDRLAACKETESALAFLDTVEPGDRLRTEIESRCQAAENDQREAQRKALVQEAAREAHRQASRDSARLLCRDGTLSPSCLCGGSRRGCCSHHGGVAGCSQ